MISNLTCYGTLNSHHTVMLEQNSPSVWEFLYFYLYALLIVASLKGRHIVLQFIELLFSISFKAKSTNFFDSTICTSHVTSKINNFCK